MVWRTFPPWPQDANFNSDSRSQIGRGWIGRRGGGGGGGGELKVGLVRLKPGFHGPVNYCTVSSAVKTGTAYCTANLFPWVACFNCPTFSRE